MISVCLHIVPCYMLFNCVCLSVCQAWFICRSCITVS